MPAERNGFRSLDDVDRAILNALLTNARVSLADLGRAVSLSPNAVAARLRRLERAGVVQGYTAVLDPAVSRPAIQALVEIRVSSDTGPGDIEPRLTAMPQVVEILDVSGRADYVVRVACADTDELYRVLQALRSAPGVVATETRTVLRSVLDRRR